MAELGRRYGFFRCPGCSGQWESSRVYVNNMTGEVAYKQKCKKCNIECDPYHVEELKCSICGMVGELCKCTQEEKMSRHVNKKRPRRKHRHARSRSRGPPGSPHERGSPRGGSPPPLDDYDIDDID